MTEEEMFRIIIQVNTPWRMRAKMSSTMKRDSTNHSFMRKNM
jgi:hypothetical protein